MSCAYCNGPCPPSAYFCSARCRNSAEVVGQRTPSPEQIAVATAEIRQGWSAEEAFRRAGIKREAVDTLVIPVRGLKVEDA